MFLLMTLPRAPLHPRTLSAYIYVLLSCPGCTLYLITYMNFFNICTHQQKYAFSSPT